jgi:DNA-directed RNA polymerase subunit RPC12/RpoP
MSTIEIRCPHCGSQNVVKREIKDEYGCSYCGTVFRIMEYSQKSMRYLSGFNCSNCGRPVGLEGGYRCTKCGRENLCAHCVGETISGKIVCIECDANSRPIICPACGGRLKDNIKFGNRQCLTCGTFFQASGRRSLH